MRKKSIKGDLIKKLSLIFISIFAFTFLGVYTIVNKSLNHVKNVALENVTSAKKLLEILPDSESKQMLFDLADFVLERHS